MAVLSFIRLPSPTGPHHVGTRTLHLVDRTRRETFGADREAPRELMVQFWYPTAAASGMAAPYGEPRDRALLDPLRLVRTNSLAEVPVATDRAFPLLIFSPAWDGQRWQNTCQAEDLASHGFIVAGLDHPYGSAVTVFPDGRTVHADASLALDLSTDAAYAKFLAAGEAQLKLRAADVQCVLDEVTKLNGTEGWLRGRVDLERIGVFGHSFGGAVAAEVCAIDPRIKAALDMDGILFGRARTGRITQPFLFLNDDGKIPTAEQIAADHFSHFVDRGMRELDAFLTRSGGMQVTIRGTGHASYSDAPLLPHLRGAVDAGTIDPGRAAAIINAWSVAFFEKTLLGKASPLLSGAKLQPEVELKNYRSAR